MSHKIVKNRSTGATLLVASDSVSGKYVLYNVEGDYYYEVTEDSINDHYNPFTGIVFIHQSKLFTRKLGFTIHGEVVLLLDFTDVSRRMTDITPEDLLSGVSKKCLFLDVNVIRYTSAEVIMAPKSFIYNYGRNSQQS